MKANSLDDGLCGLHDRRMSIRGIARSTCACSAVVVLASACSGGSTGSTGADHGGSGGAAGSDDTGRGQGGAAGSAIAPDANAGGSSAGASNDAGAVSEAGSTVDAGAPGESGGPIDAGVAMPDAGRPMLDPGITGIVGAVDSTRIMNDIVRLTQFTTRNTCSDNTAGGNAIGAARDWIRSRYQAIPGLMVSVDSFTYAGCASGMVTDQNVVAVKLGTGHRDRVIVLGGHYDSRTYNSTDPTGPAPGANDSGSQTAVLLEAARVMSTVDFDATIMFASFAAEEQGFHGSAQLAKDYAMYVTPNAKVEAMFSIDIVGGDNLANDATALHQFRLFSPGTPREFNLPMGVTDDESPSRGVMRYIGYWGGAYVPSMTMIPVLREDRPNIGSDHESFINLGYPGVRFLDTIEYPNAAMPGGHRHTPDDLPKYITPEYTQRMAEIAISVAATMARAPTAPQMPTATGNAGGSITVGWTAPVSGTAVDHYVVAARPTTENFYHTRVAVPGTSTSVVTNAVALGVVGASAFYISVSAVDAGGHEALFAYPEYRCDAMHCVVPPDSLDITARN
jgi:hypothetical protein